ncbi:UDP-N-acetylmuramoyl-L-alanine--D-glutamate ligase [Paenibacillus turpanensis]|uniref:UDP-N-acetylmuramoyl-L-alanine--D-glutamate ligase n=1 Tax=Paenibacillus turpanensis TaxID=2689078 RepID=UPI00140E492A|nr:UDP-N-acetylmuramoyl-L-alanine--D-glutamate ligase [Paenibacillus turpanensis]
MEHPRAYQGRQVVVLGLARSGVAVAKLLHQFGAVVTVNDKKERKECPEADELEALGIFVICGGHPDNLIHQDVALVVKNPGIPYSVPPVARALELGIEVVTEVEVAYWISKAPIIGITGSNGKTTTTTWAYRMLQRSGISAIIAGNIGRALTEAAIEAKEGDWLVAELSSFQLKGTAAFRPRIAALLNLAETHLDYHGTMEDYSASKRKLFANQTAEDTAVLNADHPVTEALAAGGELKAKIMRFSRKQKLTYGVYSDPDTCVLYYADGSGGVHRLVHEEELSIPGKHNVENALAAAALAIASGAAISAIIEELKEFRGVEHRLEFVRELDGVLYYNNSKATNATATIKAVESFQAPIVLIAGGLDRGAEYEDLIPYFRTGVKALVALGQTRHKLEKAAKQAGLNTVKVVDTVENAEAAIAEAVSAAFDFAEQGDVVLLAPACASWDMFPSYEERGRMFKKSVHNL